MKKIFIPILAIATLASCNRNEDTIMSTGPLSSAENGLIHYKAEDIQGDFTTMNQTVGLSGKTGSQLNFTYRGYANPVEVPGGAPTTELAASAIFQLDDMIFVAWHTNDYGNLTGTVGSINGSLCAYRISGIGQYTLTDRVDFEEHDLYALSAYRNTETGNIEVFVTGQRDQASSGYVLNGHAGAVVARVDYDYINDEFWEPSFRELPLLGVAGTGIVAAGKSYFVVTGDGIRGANAAASNHGVFEIDRSMTNVKYAATDIVDGLDIIVDPTNVTAGSANMYVLDNDPSGLKIKRYNVTGGLVSGAWQTSVSALGELSKNDGLGLYNQTTVDLDPGPGVDLRYNYSTIPNFGYVPQSKAHMVWAQGEYRVPAGARPGSNLDSLLICYGDDGWVFRAKGGLNPVAVVPNSPVPATTPAGTTADPHRMRHVFNHGVVTAMQFDPSLGVLYLGDENDRNGKANISVLAMGEYASDKVLVDQFDLVGKLVLPDDVNGLAVPNHSINDITIFQTRNLAVSVGDEGLFFVQRNK